jgi:hypothetical protein
VNKLPDSTRPLLNAIIGCYERIGTIDAGKATLLTLIAFTGFTDHPIAGRVVGNGSGQEQLGQFIERLAGKARARLISSLTDAGIMSLGHSKLMNLACLIYCGPLNDPGLLAALRFVFLRLKLRSLDGSPTGVPRYRQMDRQIACILLRADELSDPEFLGNSVTIRINQTAKSLQRNFAILRQDFSGSAQTNPSNDPEIIAIRERVARIDWTRPVSFPRHVFQERRVTDRLDVSRLHQLFALATVVRLLDAKPSDGRDSLMGTWEDIEIVIALFDESGVDDERQPLSNPEVAMLHFLQLNRDKFIANRSSGPSQTNGLPTGNQCGPFTLYNVKDAAGSNISVDTIENRFQALENAGLLRANGKIGKKNAWDLTEKGMSYQRTSLSHRLRNLVSNSENSEAT